MKYTRWTKKFLLLSLSLALLFDSPLAVAEEQYKNGKTILLENSDMFKAENGFFVPVPVDYNDASKGVTDIYAHFKKAYNPLLPTYILFTGGPGQSSHFSSGGKVDLYAELGYNFLLFDQRGIAFSRPDNELTWKNPEFHSSENNARDLEEIRRFLKIEKLSVYGASYGTVPATIYGHLYPDRTRSVVLEGVVYDGFDVTPQKDNFLVNLTQNYFNSLPQDVKNKLNRISDDKIVSKMWLPAYVQAFLMHSGMVSLPLLTDMLQQATRAEDSQFMTEFHNIQNEKNKGYTAGKNLDEDLVNSMILTKEFGMARTDITTQLILNNGKIERQITGELSQYVSAAKKFNLPLEKHSTYVASDYPLTVPTYYIQGSRDGATIPQWAIKHWKAVPKNEAYLFILKDGGHMPGGQILTFGLDENKEVGNQASAFFQEIFRKMLDASPIDKDLISKWNDTGKSKFSFTSKNLQKTDQCGILFN